MGYIGAVDDILSAQGMILPGIGDAGDRQFGTPNDEIPNLLPAADTPQKRKRDGEDN
eukprot:NODE_3418_length_446_cov_165.725441_g2988_i0.p2 GENE.NODE_3418_length_446_cov_165.725441_g2988_i0~~NODE_3418_length_446_cov_165.725441_g2988_i0.p2  ORF type:complete len:57 (-),score=3.74 NODE_3418_length_446_cov_165.725441_g2988_i0:244-414(-)